MWIVPLTISMIIMGDSIVHRSWDRSGGRVPYLCTLNMVSTITYSSELHIHLKISSNECRNVFTINVNFYQVTIFMFYNFYYT